MILGHLSEEKKDTSRRDRVAKRGIETPNADSLSAVPFRDMSQLCQTDRVSMWPSFGLWPCLG